MGQSESLGTAKEMGGAGVRGSGRRKGCWWVLLDALERLLAEEMAGQAS